MEGVRNHQAAFGNAGIPVSLRCLRAIYEQILISRLVGFTLTDPSCTTAGCAFSGGAPAGECTGNVGTLSFPEINRLIGKGAKVTLDQAAAVKNVVYDTKNWVSYDVRIACPCAHLTWLFPKGTNVFRELKAYLGSLERAFTILKASRTLPSLMKQF